MFSRYMDNQILNRVNSWLKARKKRTDDFIVKTAGSPNKS